LPDEPGLATLLLWLEDNSGTVRARNYVNVEIFAAPASRQERTADGWRLRFEPGNYSSATWPHLPAPFPEAGTWGRMGLGRLDKGVETSVPPPNRIPASWVLEKVAGTGFGEIIYTVPMPADVDPGHVSGVRFLAELGARAGMGRIEWPRRGSSSHYPQTEPDRRFPSDVTISLGGIEVATVTLPDDPCDARGVLSHHNGLDPGSYGYLVDVAVPDGAVPDLRDSLGEGVLTVRVAVAPNAGHLGGLAIYGARVGAYPLGPTIILGVS
jgi:hypothetical protein